MPSTPTHPASNSLEPRAVETLALNEKIFSAAPLGISVYRADGQCVMVNDAACRIGQATRDQLLRQNFRQLETWQRSGLLPAADAALANGQIQVIDVHITSTYGSELWIVCRLTSFQLDGQPHLLLMTEDVMEERKAEEQLQAQKKELEEHLARQTAELRQSEQTLRSLIDAFPEIAFLITPQGMALAANRNFAERFGVTTDQIIGTQIMDLLPPDLAASRGEQIQKVIATGRPQEFEDHRAGRIMNTVVNPVYDLNGQLLSLAIFIFDITERKHNQEELYQSRQMLRLVMDTIPQRVFWKDHQLRYLGCNLPFATDVGVDSPEKIIGLSDYDLHERDFAEQFRTYDAQVIESGLPRLDYEERQAKPDGTQMWLHTCKVPLRDPAGNIIGVLGVYEDISAQKRAQALLEERTHDLARSNADLEQFAYVTSHDLQEPLRMVSSFTQLLERRYRGQLDERANEYIHFITEGSQRMHRLINDLLSYSRVGTRGRPFAAVELESVLAQVAENLQIALEESGARLTHDPLPVVYGDEIQLVQLLQNLIANAIKFRSAEPPSIHLSAALKDKDWAISVRDNGIGIEPQYFERVFVIFQRLHLREEYPGTGIGLAICKKIVERHGGQIWVESTPGQGSIFTFTVPSFSGQPIFPSASWLAT